AKKYADEVATAKANLAQANAIANADGKITEEERKRIQQAQENLNTAISKADKAKQDAINEANRVAELKKQEAINSANSHADSKANEALNNAKAFVNAEITTVNTHLNKATAEINVLKEKIESKVSQSDIDKSIQEIKIGGRNLALNSSRFELPARNTGTASDNYNYISIDANLLLNSEYTISANVEIVSGSIKEISIYDYPGGKCSRVPIINNRITYTFTKRSNTVNSVLLYAGLAGETRGNSVIFTNVMLEKGNMVSDWSPAPEDTDKLIIDNIKTVTDKITTVESKFTQENNSIKASVQDLNSTTQSITTNVSNINRDLTSKINSNLDAAKSFATDIATNKANTAKQEAINSANSHADNIAATKATEALNNAKAYTNAEITTVNTKVHNLESGIDILKDQIKSKVSQSDIDKSISTIQIGGRNLFLDSDLQICTKSKNWFDNFKSLVTTENNLNYATMRGTQWFFGQYVELEEGQTYTASCLARVNKASQLKSFLLHIKLDAIANVDYVINKACTDNFQRISYTFVWSRANARERIHFLLRDSSAIVDIALIKLEKGNKATDWSPAPEDVNTLVTDSIKIVDSKISDVSSSVTQLRDSVTTDIRAINSKTHSIETTLGGKASKQEVTEVNNRVATIKASLDSITQRVSSTESKTNSLETNINGKASKQELTVVNNKVTEVTASLNGITQRVSSSESRINTLDGKVNNATTKQEFTEFKQSSEKFQLEVKSSSDRNFVSNPIFNTGDLSGWNIWSQGTSYGVYQDTSLSHKYSLKLQCFKPSQGVTQTISGLVYGKNYTFKAKVWVEEGTPGLMVRNNNTWNGAIFESSQGYKKWVELKIKFTAKEGTTLIYIGNVNSSSQVSTFWVSEVMFHEGWLDVSFTDRTKEIYSNTMKIDEQGVECKFEDGTYVQMGCDGFEWYNAGTGHAYHALTYVTSFDIPIGNPGKAYIRLPAEFTKRRSSLKWTVALRGYYYSTDGDFFPFHIHCTGGRDYIENGLVVCEVQGYCKIQNAQNAGDIQFRPLTAMLIAIA
ncbi:hypothetical protein JJB78_04720, partial [Clostridium perfringens]|nr:hypothetical protein [Clostridium perfringens]